MTRVTPIARWQDWTSFALGLWLAISPWVAGFSQHEAPTANAAFLGLVIALAAHFECTFDECTMEWLNVAAGAWLVAAPFVLGFSHLPLAAANSIAVGALIMALSASALSLDKEIGKWWQEWHKRGAGRI
jgi:hypothetical protein